MRKTSINEIVRILWNRRTIDHNQIVAIKYALINFKPTDAQIEEMGAKAFIQLTDAQRDHRESLDAEDGEPFGD